MIAALVIGGTILLLGIGLAAGIWLATRDWRI
jgi:hypothetical protein